MLSLVRGCSWVSPACAAALLEAFSIGVGLAISLPARPLIGSGTGTGLRWRSFPPRILKSRPLGSGTVLIADGVIVLNKYN